ncbi:MAG: TIGR04283 family arsenosugar biosynthesis glycosyltransferase [Bacteroidota bacterium]
MHVHIIIPALDEAENLKKLLPYLREELKDRGRIIVSDGGSRDNTRRVCTAHGVTFFQAPKTGRGPQMNAAVDRYPKADIYYFLHADARPPQGFYEDLVGSVDMGYPVGCYRFKFDSDHPLLAINSFFTRFSPLACRGGDQSLYVTSSVFEELGGFKSGMQIMEDYDIIERARAKYPFRIIPRSVTVSARKYEANNYFKVQLANLIVFRMYRRGARQEAMVEKYRAMLS